METDAGKPSEVMGKTLMNFPAIGAVGIGFGKTAVLVRYVFFPYPLRKFIEAVSTGE